MCVALTSHHITLYITINRLNSFDKFTFYTFSMQNFMQNTTINRIRGLVKVHKCHII